MGEGHDHGTGAITHEKPLWWAFGLTATFLIAEVVGGVLTNSLALLSDAAHMGTEVIALAISLVAVRLTPGRRPPDARRQAQLGLCADGGHRCNGQRRDAVVWLIREIAKKRG